MVTTESTFFKYGFTSTQNVSLKCIKILNNSHTFMQAQKYLSDKLQDQKDW